MSEEKFKELAEKFDIRSRSDDSPWGAVIVMAAQRHEDKTVVAYGLSYDDSDERYESYFTQTEIVDIDGEKRLLPFFLSCRQVTMNLVSTIE